MLVNICISDLFSQRERAKYFGIVGMIWALASAIGPVLGGIFAQKGKHKLQEVSENMRSLYETSCIVDFLHNVELVARSLYQEWNPWAVDGVENSAWKYRILWAIHSSSNAPSAKRGIWLASMRLAGH